MTAQQTTRARKPRKPAAPEAPDLEKESATAPESACSEPAAHPDGMAELERLEAEHQEEPPAGETKPDEPEQPGWSAIQSAGLLHMAFGAIAQGAGAHWALTDPEAQGCGQALDAVLEKYFPDGPGKYGPEIALFSSVVVIVAPRLAKTAEINARKRQQQAQHEHEQQQPERPEGELAPGEV